MKNNTINPEKITKPIQILGAWLAGLFSINSCFLVGAANMPTGSFESIGLVVATIVNVPLFLMAVFLLQTKYRPELQEDSYYSTYLSQKTNEPIKVNREDARFKDILLKIENIESKLNENTTDSTTSLESFHDLKFSINRNLANKDIVKEKLAEKGILGSAIFGGEEAPQYMMVAFSRSLRKEVMEEILKIASETGFKSYGFFDPQEEYEIIEDVLFGAYGEPQYDILI